MPIFYRGPRAIITHAVVELPDGNRRRFVVADLTDVHIVRHDPDPEASGRRALGVSALAAAVIAVPLMRSASVLLTGLIALVLVVNAAICLRPRPRHWWQVRAGYRGAVVEVFASEDEREFTEFCRGLVRSLEFRGF